MMRRLRFRCGYIALGIATSLQAAVINFNDQAGEGVAADPGKYTFTQQSLAGVTATFTGFRNNSAGETDLRTSADGSSYDGLADRILVGVSTTGAAFKVDFSTPIEVSGFQISRGDGSGATSIQGVKSDGSVVSLYNATPAANRWIGPITTGQDYALVSITFSNFRRKWLDNLEIEAIPGVTVTSLTSMPEPAAGLLLMAASLALLSRPRRANKKGQSNDCDPPLDTAVI